MFVCFSVVATLLAGFASSAVFADEMLACGGALHAMVALLEKWSRWPGPPNHAWNRRASRPCPPRLFFIYIFVFLYWGCGRYMQFLLAAVLLGLDLRQHAPAAPVRDCCQAAPARSRHAFELVVINVCVHLLRR